MYTQRWIKIINAEIIGDHIKTSEVDNFEKCKEICEKDIDCRGISFIFKQCKVQMGNIYVRADSSTVGCLYEGAIKL